MNKDGKFKYNNKYCAIVYEKHKFNLTIFSDENYTIVEKQIVLFPVIKFSESQKLTAFHVANLHVLPKLYYKLY